MPLFGSFKDSRFLLGINRELINKYIDSEIAVYKISLEDTEKNIYGESNMKVYYEPVRVHALIRNDDETYNSSDTGIDVTHITSFGIIKEDLKNLNLFLEVGDVIFWNEAYYEIDQIRGAQYWGNRNDSTLIGNVLKEHVEYGYEVSVIADCHLTRATRIQIKENSRPDIDGISIKNDPPRRNSIYGE